MKKISFFLFYREKKKMIYQLQKAGNFHLEFRQTETRPNLVKMKKLRERYETIENELQKYADISKDMQRLEFPPHLKSLRERLQYIEDRLSLKESFENALKELEADRKISEPWGDFSWSNFDELRAKGLQIRFHIASERIFAGYDFSETIVCVIHRSAGSIKFLTLEYDVEASIFPFEETRLPSRSLGEICREIEFIKKNLEDAERELSRYATTLEDMGDTIRRLESRILFEKAKGSLVPHESQTFYHLEGWFPAAKEREIRSLLEKNGITYSLREPWPEENVPILLRNGIFSKLFEPITRIFSLPEYFEFDPTPFFAPFFTIFFGLCLGDLGYGLLLASVSLSFFFIGPTRWRLLASLGLALGFSASISGLLTNTIFGYPIFAFALDSAGQSVGLFEKGIEFAPFASVTKNGKTIFPVIGLSLFLGYVQILFGILLRVINEWRYRGLSHALAPFGRIMLILGATILVLHGDYLGLGFNAKFKVGPWALGAVIAMIPSFAGSAVLGIGFLLFFLFNHPGKKILLRPLFGIWEFYGFLTGLLGDLLSYIRLFALGLASGLLGSAFNQMAGMVLPRTVHGPVYMSPWIILSIFILVFGHGLNLGLSLLGSFVHPLRLTFVEFYKNMQYRGGGRMYRAFAVFK